jgi:hypothetical protein
MAVKSIRKVSGGNEKGKLEEAYLEIFNSSL